MVSDIDFFERLKTPESVDPKNLLEPMTGNPARISDTQERINQERDFLEKQSQSTDHGVDFFERIRKRNETLDTEQRGVDEKTRPREEILGEDAGVTVQSGEFDDFMKRVDLSMSSDLQEKKNKFLKKYPLGDLIEVRSPGISDKNRILVKRNEEEDYIELDSPSFNAIDLADFTGELPNIAVSALVTGKGKLLTEIGKQMGGEFVVETLKELADKIRGVQEESLSESLGGAAISGGAAGLGGALGGVPAKAGDVVTGRGITKVSPTGKKALAAQKKLGLPTLAADQIAESKIIKVLGKQSRGLITSLTENTREQNKAVFRTIVSLSDPQLKQFVEGDIESLHEEMIKDLTNTLRKTEGSMVKAGDDISNALSSYETVSQAIVSRQYAKAAAAGGVSYDISPIHEVIRSMDIGVKAPVAGKPETLNLENIVPAVSDVIEKFNQIDFSQESIVVNGEKFTQTDWLRSLRSDLFYIKSTSLLGATPQERKAINQAKRLYGVVTNTLRNPTSGDPLVAELYKQADTAAAKRFEALSRSFVKEGIETQEKTSFVRNFLSPGNYDQILFAKELVDGTDPAKWKEMQDSFISEITSKNGEKNIFSLPETLAAYPQRELDLIIPKEDQVVLKEIAKNVERVRLLNINDILVRQDKTKAQMREIVANKNSASVTQLIDVAKRNPEKAKSIRAAVMDNVIEDIVVKDKTMGMVVDNNLLDKKLQDINDSGVIKLLTLEDIKMLKRAGDYAAAISLTKADAGTSLQTAQAAAEIREIISFTGSSGSGFITLFEAFGTAKLLLSPTLRKIVLGDPTKKPLDSRATRVISSQMFADVVDLMTEDRGEQE